MSTTISLTVNVLDVLDPAPHFTQSTYRVEVAEGVYSMVRHDYFYSISSLWKLYNVLCLFSTLCLMWLPLTLFTQMHWLTILKWLEVRERGRKRVGEGERERGERERGEGGKAGEALKQREKEREREGGREMLNPFPWHRRCDRWIVPCEQCKWGQSWQSDSNRDIGQRSREHIHHQHSSKIHFNNMHTL